MRKWLKWQNGSSNNSLPPELVQPGPTWRTNKEKENGEQTKSAPSAVCCPCSGHCCVMNHDECARTAGGSPANISVFKQIHISMTVSLIVPVGVTIHVINPQLHKYNHYNICASIHFECAAVSVALFSSTAVIVSV